MFLVTKCTCVLQEVQVSPERQTPDGTILQVADQQFFDEYSDFASTIEHFATIQGFGYHQVILSNEYEGNTSFCVYTRKVIAIAKMLSALPSNAWLWYFDMDVAFTGISAAANALEKFFDKANASLRSCHFVAQDAKEQINTGCFLIKNTMSGRTLMNLWLSKQLQHQPCRKGTSADQVTLQDAVLEILLPHYREELCLTFCGSPHCLNDCTSHNCTPPLGAPWDWSRGVPNTRLANECYGRLMVSHELPVDHRAAGSVCLLPRSVRFNAHDLEQNKNGYWYQEGDMFFVPHGFYHWWKISTREAILHRLKLVARNTIFPRII